MPNIEVPEVLRPYGVTGIFVGGCVKRGDGSSFRAKAHAHCDPKLSGDRYGWICFRSAKRLYLNGSTRPSVLLWHEAGHIYRRSWTEKQVEAWARKQTAIQGLRIK